MGPGRLNEQNRGRTGRRSVWSAMFLAMAMVTACQTTITQRPNGSRILTEFEMDGVTAGSAVATYDAAAHARGSEARTAVLGSVSTSSEISPILGPPLLNYATSEVTASAGGDKSAEARLSTTLAVDGTNGGASITATAEGVGTNRAQVTAQFYGTSTTRADVEFGSVAAAACCGSGSEAQVKLNTATGGPYSTELQGAPVSSTPGQAASRIDVTIVSSTLPMLDPAQVSVTGAATRVAPNY